MPDDARVLRLSRELFLAAAAPPSIPTWAVERLASAVDELDVVAGQVLFPADAPLDFLYFMRDGGVRMEREGAPAYTFEGRWAIGGFDLIAETPSRRAARALRSFRVQRLPAEVWLEIIEDSFELAHSLLFNASRATSRIEEQFGESPGPAPLGAAAEIMPEGPLRLVERLTTLVDVVALRRAGVQALADLAAVTEEVTFEPGELLAPQSASSALAYVLVEGSVEASRAAPAMVRSYGPGELVHGARAVVGQMSSWRARAQARTRVLAVRVEDLVDLMEEHFDLFRAVFASLGVERSQLLEQAAARHGDVILQ